MIKRDFCFDLKNKLSELKTLCRHLEDCSNMMDDIDYQRVEGKNKLILKKCVNTA